MTPAPIAYTADTRRPDLEWDVAPLHDTWPRSPDSSYILNRIYELTTATAAAGAHGRILDLACGDGHYAMTLARQGFPAVGLEPSPHMLARAMEKPAAERAGTVFVRGIAETLPFKDHAFDRIICESSLDHLADPAAGLREMARILTTDGRLILGVVNYGSLSVRLSRLLYRIGRRVGWIRPGTHMFWDTPVPHEHSFECTYPRLLRLGEQCFDLIGARGVSFRWSVPGWGPLLAKLPGPLTSAVLIGLDHVAYVAPRTADYIISVWGKKSPTSTPTPTERHPERRESNATKQS